VTAAVHAARLLIILLGLLSTRAAAAHQIGLSRGQYTLHSETLEARLTFDADELGIPTRDAPRALASREVHAAIQSRIIDHVGVRDRRGAACPGTLERLDPLDTGGVALIATYRCSDVLDSSSIELGFWSELTPGHRHLANAGAQSEQLLYRERAHLELAAAEPAPLSALAWIRLGVEHILGGYDHLLFLLALLLVTPGLRTLAATVSIFTLAHSVTLALSTLDLFAPPPSLVECAIALSIIYVGLENLTDRASRPRHAIVFGFGLIHGFGFAGALAELGLPAARTPGALLSFNVGVELGQLAVIALAYPVVRGLTRTRWFVPRGVPALSLCTAFAGLVWFVERV
jgi:hydrogenase/urease accessory protein HupE